MSDADLLSRVSKLEKQLAKVQSMLEELPEVIDAIVAYELEQHRLGSKRLQTKKTFPTYGKLKVSE